MSIKKILKYICIILVVVFFVLLLINTDFKEIWNNLKEISIWVILILILLQIGTQLLLTLQWYRISKSILGESKFGKMFYILSTGSVIESITPGAKIGGEVTRLYNLKKEMNASTDNAANIIVIQKSISMIVLFIVCLSSFTYLSYNISMNINLVSKIFINILCVLLIVSLFSILCLSSKLSIFLERYNNKVITKINKFIKSYSNSTKLISKKEWSIQFSISTIVWLLFPIKMLILAYSLGININLFIVIGITMTSYMLGTLPLTPGGLGTFEGSMIALFSLVDINNAISTALTIVFRTITFWFVMILSSLYVVVYKRSGRSEREDNKEPSELL